MKTFRKYLLTGFVILSLSQFGFAYAADSSDLAKGYAAALGAMIIFGPQAGTEDHYSFEMPNGREFTVTSKSR